MLGRVITYELRRLADVSGGANAASSSFTGATRLSWTNSSLSANLFVREHTFQMLHRTTAIDSQKRCRCEYPISLSLT